MGSIPFDILHWISEFLDDWFDLDFLDDFFDDRFDDDWDDDRWDD